MERKYDFENINVQKKIGSTWVKIRKKIRFYEGKPWRIWAERVFEPYRWKIKKYNPPVYKKVYNHIERLENKIYIGKPERWA